MISLAYTLLAAGYWRLMFAGLTLSVYWLIGGVSYRLADSGHIADTSRTRVVHFHDLRPDLDLEVTLTLLAFTLMDNVFNSCIFLSENKYNFSHPLLSYYYYYCYS